MLIEKHCLNRFYTLILALFLLAGSNLLVAETAITAEQPGKPSNNNDKSQRPRVILETSLGNITIELDHKRAPISTANFLQYVSDGHYDGTIFHRVINNFMVQGGGFDVNMNEKPVREPIHNEADNNLQNTIFTVAMARINEPHSARAQFFINVNNNGYLNHKDKSTKGWGYAVFGRVVEGMNVVYQIKRVPTARYKHHHNVPVTPVIINRAYIRSNQNPGNSQNSSAVPKEKPRALDNDDIEVDTGMGIGKPKIKLPGMGS